MAANQTVNVYGKIIPTYMEQIPTAQRKAITGLAFPLGISKTSGGIFSRRTGIKMIKEAVKQVLLTEKGERVMLPNFGCNLRKYLFQPLDETIFSNIRTDIETAFNTYVVGAKIAKLAVFPYGETGPSGGNSLKVILTLKLDTDDLEVFDVEVNIS